MKSQPNLWERQPGESAKAYEARHAYLVMGSGRSLAGVGQMYGKCRGQIERWSRRWKWVESALAYDRHREAIEREARLAAMEKKAKADADKWARRHEELPELQYTAFINAYNDLCEYVSKVKAGTVVASVKDKAILIRSLALMSPLAERALEIVARRQAMTPPPRSAAPPGVMSGRAKAALRAFHEHKDADDP